MGLLDRASLTQQIVQNSGLQGQALADLKARLERMSDAELQRMLAEGLAGETDSIGDTVKFTKKDSQNTYTLTLNSNSEEGNLDMNPDSIKKIQTTFPNFAAVYYKNGIVEFRDKDGNVINDSNGNPVVIDFKDAKSGNAALKSILNSNSRIIQMEYSSRDIEYNVPEKRFAATFLAHIYNNAADILEAYYHDHGAFDGGTIMEGWKNIIDRASGGLLGKGTLHLADEYRETAKKFQELSQHTGMSFDKNFEALTGKEFNVESVQKLMQMLNAGEDENIQDDEFKKACEDAFGFRANENAEKYADNNRQAGEISDIALMLLTLGEGAVVKATGKVAQRTFATAMKQTSKILSEKAATKASRLASSAVAGGTNLGVYTASKETINNLSNPMRDATDVKTWQTTVEGSFQSAGFGAFGGIWGQTAVSKVMQWANKASSRTIKALAPKFAQGSVKGSDVVRTFIETSANSTKLAEAMGFGTEVLGFTGYEAAMNTVSKLDGFPDNLSIEDIENVLKKEFGNQFTSLGKIKMVSHFIMMMSGGRAARMAAANNLEALIPSLNEVEVKQLENGAFEVSTPNGTRILCKNMAEVMTSCTFLAVNGGVEGGNDVVKAPLTKPEVKVNDRVRAKAATTDVKPNAPESPRNFTMKELQELKQTDSSVQQMPDGTVVKTDSNGKTSIIGRLVNNIATKAKNIFNRYTQSEIKVTKETINTVRQRFLDNNYLETEIADIINLFKQSPNLLYEISLSPDRYDLSTINKIFQMNTNNPNLAKKLLARDNNGEFKLSEEQQREILFCIDSSLVTEELLDSLAVLHSKGIENAQRGIFDTKEKVDVMIIMSKYINLIDKNTLDSYITAEKIDNIINFVKTSEDVQIIDNYLKKYKNNEIALTQVLLTLNHQIANTAAEKQPFLKNIVENLLDKNLTACDINKIINDLNKIDFSNFDKDGFISKIKDVDNVEKLRLFIVTKDEALVNELLTNERYKSYSIEDKKLIAELVEQNNISLSQATDNYEYYQSRKTPHNNPVVDGRRLSRQENLKYMVTLPDASRVNSDFSINPDAPVLAPKTAKSATATRELADLVEDGLVGNHVLKYLPKEGEINPLVAQDIHRFYEAYLNGENLVDVLVPGFHSLDEASLDIGEVFEIAGESKIYIKGANGENVQLNIDKATYCKLFPPIERFASTQNSIGNCWEITGFNTLFRDPQERSRVLQCFKQNGDDVVIEFPNSSRQYSLSGMQAAANMDYYSEGALGLNLLEYADGKELYRERADMFIENLSNSINDPSIDHSTRQKLQTKLDNFLAISEQEKNNVYLNRVGYIDTNPKKFDGASTYTRDGGLSYNVFRRLGYNNPHSMWFQNQKTEIAAFLTNPESFTKHVVTYAPGGIGMESEINRSKGIYSNHAYMITPNFDSNRNIKDYNLLNPWGIVETTLTLDEIKKYGKHISIAER